MASPYPSVPQCSPTQPTAFADTSTNITTFSTANNYPFLDGSASILLQQGQRPNDFSQVYISDQILLTHFQFFFKNSKYYLFFFIFLYFFSGWIINPSSLTLRSLTNISFSGQWKPNVGCGGSKTKLSQSIWFRQQLSINIIQEAAPTSIQAYGWPLNSCLILSS